MTKQHTSVPHVASQATQADPDRAPPAAPSSSPPPLAVAGGGRRAKPGRRTAAAGPLFCVGISWRGRHASLRCCATATARRSSEAASPVGGGHGGVVVRLQGFGPAAPARRVGAGWCPPFPAFSHSFPRRSAALAGPWWLLLCCGKGAPDPAVLRRIRLVCVFRRVGHSGGLACGSEAGVRAQWWAL